PTRLAGSPSRNCSPVGAIALNCSQARLKDSNSRCRRTQKACLILRWSPCPSTPQMNRTGFNMKMRHTLFAGFGALIIAAGLGAGTARADCVLSIQPVQDQWLIPHDPFAGDSLQRQFDVALVNLGDSSCSGRLGMDLRGEAFGLTQAGDSQRVAYALIDERGGTDVPPRTGQSARRINAQPLH